MIKINRKVEYALMALKLMKEKHITELTTAREVCDRFETPFDTTAKVMQIMNNAGILQSHKGVKGGYTLSKDLSHVSYMELVQLIEGKSFMMDCQHGPCDLIKKCNISRPIKRLNDYLINIFNTLSLNELLSEDNVLAFNIVSENKAEHCSPDHKVKI
jgi:Rrf2 family protein